MHVDLNALRLVVRETLDAFVRDHEGLDFAEVDILDPTALDGACDIVVDGCRFTVSVG